MNKIINVVINWRKENVNEQKAVEGSIEGRHRVKRDFTILSGWRLTASGFSAAA